MKFRPAFALLSLTLALAACDELPFTTAPEPAVPAHSGPPTVSPLEQPIQTSNEGRAISTAEATTMNTAMFRASGNQPSWAVTADTNNAVFERAGAKSVGIKVQRLTYVRGVEYIGVLNGRPFSLNIQAANCTDAASGQKLPFTARVTANGQRLTGCAGPATAMPKAQTRASTAAPAAKRAAPAAAPAAKPEPVTTPDAASKTDTTPVNTEPKGVTPQTSPTEVPKTTAPDAVTPPATTTPPATSGGATDSTPKAAPASTPVTTPDAAAEREPATSPATTSTTPAEPADSTTPAQPPAAAAVPLPETESAPAQ